MPKLPAILARLDAELEMPGRPFEFLRLQSIATDPAYAGDAGARRYFVGKDLVRWGLRARCVRPTGTDRGRQVGPSSGAPRVLFYGHYDVQPVDPLELWETPPFAPRMETRLRPQVIVARGACDDKGQVMTFIEACRALRRDRQAAGDVTMLIEGEEECGSRCSPSSRRMPMSSRRLALVCDTGMWDRETPAVTASLRGLVYEEVTV